MANKIVVIRRRENETVTFHNFDLIFTAAEQTGAKVIEVNSTKDALKAGGRDDVYIVTTIDDARKIHRAGCKNIVNWIQGILPEESLMRHHNFLRFKVLSFLEKKAIDYCRVPVFVSEAMKKHYEQKYKRTYDRYYVFPCYNTSLHKESFSAPNKYKSNKFVYAGGLAVWQCFDETLKIYKSFENLGLPETSILVLTKDKETAEEKIKEAGIRHYEIGFYPVDQLPIVLSDAKFGFVIRKDSPVNRVSTPTKISTYISCGLIPIFGDCIDSFLTVAHNMKYAVAWTENGSSFDMVQKLMTAEIKNEDVFEEFSNVFNTYFSDEKHTTNWHNFLKTMLNEKN